MHIVVQSLLNNMREVAAFGTIAIVIITLVIIGLHGLVKEVFGLFYLISDSGQIGKPERSSILVY